MDLSKHKSLPISYAVNSEKVVQDTRYLNITIDVLHTGANYNGSVFTRETVDENIETIKNTPILGYIRLDEDGLPDDFEQHKFKVIKRDGKYLYIYAGCAYGVIPESCNPRWIEKTSSDGVTREYLQVDALLWTKFSDAADIFRRDVIKGQSMELEEQSMQGKEQPDGSFLFTSFRFDGCCILSTSDLRIQPAMIDSVAVANYSLDSIAQEIKNKLNQYTQEPADGGLDTDIPREGGKDHLNKIEEMLSKYAVSLEQLGFSIDGLSDEELEEKLIAFTAARQGAADPEPQPQSEPANEPAKTYALNSQFEEVLRDAVAIERTEFDYGIAPRYSVLDFDVALNMVYCYDRTDWKIYGFAFTVAADTVTVDFASKKRKKFTIVDFVEGDGADRQIVFYGQDQMDAAAAKISADFTAQIEKLNTDMADMAAQFQTSQERVKELESFQTNVFATQRENDEAQLFAQFAKELDGNADYEALKQDSAAHSIEALSEKCFSILGKTKANFTTKEPKPAAVKLPMAPSAANDEPYGGLHSKYRAN